MKARMGSPPTPANELAREDNRKNWDRKRAACDFGAPPHRCEADVETECGACREPKGVGGIVSATDATGNCDSIRQEMKGPRRHPKQVLQSAARSHAAVGEYGGLCPSTLSGRVLGELPRVAGRCRRSRRKLTLWIHAPSLDRARRARPQQVRVSFPFSPRFRAIALAADVTLCWSAGKSPRRSPR